MKPFLLVCMLALAAGGVRSADAPPAPGAPVPAASSAIATQATMLAAAWAGPRAVAVGDRGIVLLSDDRGASWRQARSVPVSYALTAVAFVDAKQGWAVGHGGTVLATADGGETWQLQRSAPQEDRPLFAVHFSDAKHGVAVGLWSLVIVTEDGGRTWAEQTLEPAPGAKKADLNLLALFADAQGTLYAAGERGQVLRSTDKGLHWSYLPTGYKGSLWAGAVLSDGALLVGGQRGTLLRSDDAGRSWQPVTLASRSSVTAIAAAPGAVTVVGLDGLLARSGDGRQFSLAVQPDGVALTAALPASGAPLLFSRRGVVPLVR
ncbi:MAG: glycosyl hydrolase [Burkholderiaceae bacterium]|nr:MAG: glycosyl hydrolase [Burkholderiaceae bacterium]